MALRLDARQLDSLDEIRGIFDLSEAELGELFGMTRQAVSHWRIHGIPPRRSADVSRIAELARYLASEFVLERLPQIVRTPGRDRHDSLKGRAFLDVIRDEGVMPIYRHLEALFAYSGT